MSYRKGTRGRQKSTGGLLETSLEIIPADFAKKYDWYHKNFTKAELMIMGYAAFSMINALKIRDIRESFQAINRGSRELGRMFRDPIDPPATPRHKREHIFKKPEPAGSTWRGNRTGPTWQKASRAPVTIKKSPSRILIDWSARAPRPAAK